MKQPKEILKTYFETGDKPTEQQFSDLIDSYHHVDNGVIISKIRKDEEGNQQVVLSNGSVISIEESSGVDQNNQVRIVDLGEVTVPNLEDELTINRAVANRYNQLPIEIRRVTETENIIIKADVKQVLGS